MGENHEWVDKGDGWLELRIKDIHKLSLENSLKLQENNYTKYFRDLQIKFNKIILIFAGLAFLNGFFPISTIIANKFGIDIIIILITFVIGYLTLVFTLIPIARGRKIHFLKFWE